MLYVRHSVIDQQLALAHNSSWGYLLPSGKRGAFATWLQVGKTDGVRWYLSGRRRDCR